MPCLLKSLVQKYALCSSFLFFHSFFLSPKYALCSLKVAVGAAYEAPDTATLICICIYCSALEFAYLSLYLCIRIRMRYQTYEAPDSAYYTYIHSYMLSKTYIRSYILSGKVVV